MKNLYLKLFELLKEIPEIQYIDLNFGQIMEEKPPLSYPAVLIGTGIRSTEDFQSIFQQVNASFSISIIDIAGESNSLTDEKRRERALSYLDLQEKIYRKLQGFEDSHFEPFSRESSAEMNVRKGLRIVSDTYATGWKEELATP